MTDGLKRYRIRLVGIAPLIMSNGQMADPLNKWSVELKELSGKRKKTDSDHAEMGRLEFMGRLYVDDKGHPCIPSQNLEALIVKGAKKSKEGQIAKTGLIVDGQTWAVEYDGPKDAKKLWADSKYVSRARVSMKASGSSVMRTRPMFPQWAVQFEVLAHSDLVNGRQLESWLHRAGREVGMCDWTPRHGRFSVEKFEAVE